ncbi:MAG: magnesium transporter [Chloroflexi bacterium]|nr:MAG: magnesium transporter [Chloroflexota bacterium]
MDESGREIGKLKDLVITARDQFPLVQALVVAGRDGTRIVSAADVLSYTELRVRGEGRSDGMIDGIHVARDIQDKQIVDTHGAKVVRVNDLQFSENGGALRLVGADVGVRGLLRRLGVEAPLERVATAVGRDLPRGIIPWHLVEPIAAGPAAVRLTIPHQKLALLHPADIADIVEEMTADERRTVFEQLDVETAAEALAEVEPEMQASVLADLPEERAADILEEMGPDEAADVLQDLPVERRDELIDLMQKDESEDVEELLSYDENTAGGIMTTNYVALPGSLKASEAIDKLRALKPDPESAYYLYVIDTQDRLVGVVSLRDLVVASPDERLADIMNKQVLKAEAHTNKEEVAAIIAKYDLLALPIVDQKGRLIGAVTVDDVVELMLPRGWRKRSMRDVVG